MKEEVVIIISVIYFNKNKKLSYSNIRSIFSPKERLEQTYITIKSIKEHIPKAKIFFFELGNGDLKDDYINNSVYRYIYLGNNNIVRRAVNSKYKGLGEVIGLLFSRSYLPNQFTRLFKISGRYYLNNNFSLKDWKVGNFIVKNNNNSISTRLYSISYEFYRFWIFILYISLPFLLLNISIENIIYIFTPKKYFKYLTTLGISGKIGVNNQTINE